LVKSLINHFTKVRVNKLNFINMFNFRVRINVKNKLPVEVCQGNVNIGFGTLLHLQGIRQGHFCPQQVVKPDHAVVVKFFDLCG